MMGFCLIDAIDRSLVAALQDGLPLVPRPYDAVGERVGISGAEVRTRVTHLVQRGVIRRIGAVPNHYSLGLVANGMSVWDIEDGAIDDVGYRVGGLEFVSHCYRRPRRLPAWPYNLFAMVHGTDRTEVEEKVARIVRLIGTTSRGHEILYSTRILKKTGLRIAA